MELSYSDAISDLAHYRAMGANENSLARTEGIINYCFVMINKFSKLELAYQNIQAQMLSYQEIIFGKSKSAQDNQQFPLTSFKLITFIADIDSADSGNDNTLALSALMFE